VVKKEQQENQEQSAKEKSNSTRQSALSVYARYAGMGTQMFVIILLFAWAGKKLDVRSGNENLIFTALFSLVGVILGLYIVLKDFIRKKE